MSYEKGKNIVMEKHISGCQGFWRSEELTTKALKREEIFLG